MLVVIITTAKAAATYGQTVLTQNLVLRTIRELQARMFAHLTSPTWRGWSASRRPSWPPASPPTPP